MRLKEDYIILPTNEPLAIGSLLGYNIPVTILGIPIDGQPIPANESIAQVMVEIYDIQVLISTSRVDGMAIKVGDLEVDFNTHIGRLTAEGSRKVKVLSALSGIPLIVDIFTGVVPRSGFTPYQVRSTPFV